MHKTRLWQAPAARVPVALAGAALSILLAACGGGGGSTAASVASAVPSSVQVASGTVTGFGSVYVDGVRIEDATASVHQDNMDGTLSATALRLGQQVRVKHDGKGTASDVAVGAAVIGSVSSIDAGTTSLKVAGQWVRANSDSAAGPVTVFGGGYTAFTDIAASDLVEVHGSPVYSTARAAYEVQATRIEKQSTITAVRVMGKLASIDTTAKTFGINGLTVDYAAATVVPSGATLANDLEVTVWGAPGSLVTSGGKLTLTAKRVRVLNASVTDPGTTELAQLGGLVSAYSASAKTLEIQGVKVDLASATVTPAGVTLANGSYIQVKGTLGVDGVLTATEVRIRQSDTVDDTARIKLSGAITSLTDAKSFVVRGVPVDATSASLAASCTGVTLAEGVFVDVVAKAQAGTNVVLASTVDCPSTTNLPKFPMRGLHGVASAVDATSKTFAVTPDCPAAAAAPMPACSTTVQTVQWTDQTVFTGITADTLAGATVKVDGYLNAAGVMVAREIRKPDPAALDAYDKPAVTPGSPTPNMPGPRGWDNYRKMPGHGG